MSEKILIERLRARTGISEQQAGEAVRAMLEYVREVMPEPVSEHMTCVLAGNPVPGDLVERAVRSLRGMFGRREE